MSEWKEIKLGEIADIIDPHPSHRAPEIVDRGIPFIGIGDIDETGKIVKDARKVSEKIFDEHQLRYKLDGNTIGFGRVATIGKIIRFKDYSFKFTISPTMAIIQPKTVDGDFLAFSLDSLYVKKQIEKLLTGTTRSSLGIELLRELLIPIPSIFIQRKISHIISTANAVIENTGTAIAKYKAIKQGMLHDLFTRGIDIKTGKLRPKYEDAPELYKESKLGWIPREWDDQELSKYLSFISYGFTNPMPETNEGPYLITAANVNGGRIQYETCRKTSKEAFENLLTDKSRPKVNDILLTKDGTLGRIAIVEKENLCINQSVAVLRPNKLVDPLFLKILLESPSYQKTMLDEAGGSTIKHIYITIVDKMLIGVPKEINEQKEIAIRLSAIENKVQTEQNYLNKLLQIKAGLMNDLLSGKKKVKLIENLKVEKAL